MAKKRVFRGAATALITPLTATGAVDFEKYGALIDWQIEQGIDALVVTATTGEGSTLSDDEHKECIRYAVDRIAHRVPVIAGTGSNDTAYGIQLTRAACEAGVDGVLVVTPYYNKVTQNGLVRMFYDYADASTVPVIMYNVPSRTGVNIMPKTYEKLAKHENLVGIKEANNNIAAIVETMSLVGDDLTLYSGNDDQIVPLLSVGGQGVISVLSNVCPKETHEICAKYFEGDYAGSLALQLKYFDLIKSLFCEVNPIPVKAAMAAMGFCENTLRAPLYPMEEDHYQMLLASMRNVGIEV